MKNSTLTAICKLDDACGNSSRWNAKICRIRETNHKWPAYHGEPERDDMKKAAMIFATIAALGATVATAPAEARGRHGFGGAGLGLGIAAGALAAGAYGAYGPGYGYGPRYYGPPRYAYGDGYYRRGPRYYRHYGYY
jgi:hypothetical protein